MWVSSKFSNWFQVSKDAVDELKQELASVKAERDLLKTQLLVTQNNFEWVRNQINTLQFEKTALIERAYNIKLPAPEITRQPTRDEIAKDFSFDDIGDDLAKKFGLPTYDKQFS